MCNSDRIKGINTLPMFDIHLKKDKINRRVLWGRVVNMGAWAGVRLHDGIVLTIYISL